MNFDTIVVPTDFSEDAEKALATAVELAKQLDGRVVLVHAPPTAVAPAYPGFAAGAIIPDSYYNEMRAEARGHVERVAKEAAGGGVDVSGRILSGPPSDAIVALADELGADLIVMGTRGLTGLKHVLLGSVAERVVRTAPCPVLTVKKG